MGGRYVELPEGAGAYALVWVEGGEVKTLVMDSTISEAIELSLGLQRVVSVIGFESRGGV